MDDLEKLQAQIAELQQKATELAAQRKATAIIDIKRMIHANGITAKELGLVGKEPTKSAVVGVPVAVKYQLDHFTWTGRGRQPKFIVEHLAKGGKLEDLLV